MLKNISFTLVLVSLIMSISAKTINAGEKKFAVENVNKKKAFYEFDEKSIDGQTYKIVKNKTEYSKKELESEISSIEDKIQTLQSELEKRNDMLNEFTK